MYQLLWCTFIGLLAAMCCNVTLEFESRSVFRKITEQFSNDDICFISDYFSDFTERLLMNEKLRYVLKIIDFSSVELLPICSSIILSSISRNSSEIYQYIEGNINKTESKILLVRENFIKSSYAQFFNIAWERNLNIFILDVPYEKYQIMGTKMEENDKNITLHSVMLNKKLKSCFFDDLNCLTDIFIVESPWTPRKMLKTMNRSFKVFASSHPPYFEKDMDKFKGIDFQLVELMIPTWPTTYRIFPEDHQPDEGVIYETLVEFLNTANDGDMSIGGLWLTDDFPSTHPYAKQCNTFLVHRPSLLPDSTFVFQYFQATLWLSYFGVLVFMGFLLKFTYELYGVYYSFDHSLLLILHFVANLGIPKFPDRKKFYARYVLTVWMIFCLLMTTYFCVGLTVTLRFPRFTQSINYWRDMVDLKIKWIENSEFYRDRISGWGTHDQYLKNLSYLFEYQGNVQEINRKLKKNYAVRVQRLPGYYLTNTGWLNDYAKKNFKLLSDCFLVWYNSFLFKNPTPFLEYFNMKTLEMVEYGFVKYWYQHHTNKKKNRYMMMFFNEYSDEYIQFIKLDKLKSCFLLLFCGLILSVGVFFIEVIHFSYVKKKGEKRE